MFLPWRPPGCRRLLRKGKTGRRRPRSRRASGRARAERRYRVTADSDGFYHYGPQQPSGAGPQPQEGHGVWWSNASFGYSKVKLADSQQIGYVSTEDIAPLTQQELAALAAPSAPSKPPCKASAATAKSRAPSSANTLCLRKANRRSRSTCPNSASTPTPPPNNYVPLLRADVTGSGRATFPRQFANLCPSRNRNMLTAHVFVVGDNIDTDQIIPAHYLTLVPTIREEYEKLGTYAMIGLPDDQYPVKFFPAGETNSPYKIVVAGRNFGCGSSREHAPIALGAAGVRAVSAQTYARIFFRNSVATGELYPFESVDALNEVLHTGDEVTLDFEQGTLTHEGKVYSLKPLGEVRPVVDAGGSFQLCPQDRHDRRPDGTGGGFRCVIVDRRRRA